MIAYYANNKPPLQLTLSWEVQHWGPSKFLHHCSSSGGPSEPAEKNHRKLSIDTNCAQFQLTENALLIIIYGVGKSTWVAIPLSSHLQLQHFTTSQPVSFFWTLPFMYPTALLFAKAEKDFKWQISWVRSLGKAENLQNNYTLNNHSK